IFCNLTGPLGPLLASQDLTYICLQSTPGGVPSVRSGSQTFFYLFLVQNKSFGFRSVKIQLKGILDLGSPTRPRVPPGGVPRVQSDGQTYFYLFLVRNKSFGFRAVKIHLKGILDLGSPTRPRVTPGGVPRVQSDAQTYFD